LSVVPVKLEKEDVKKLDMLVRLGVFKNRSQAIRWMIRDGMNKKIESLPQADLSGVEPVVELMLRLASRGANVIRITSTETAGEIVAEGRHRL
jgi:Arc/MetJ-type ribon-helix-helix transcriptional regulator